MTQSQPGLIKVKLLHRDGGSILLPELVLLGATSDQWVQPQYFYPPLLTWYDNDATARVSIGALDRTRQKDEGLDLQVTFKRTDREAAFDDNSELYRCAVTSDHSSTSLAVGKARRRADGGIDVGLYHHTTEKARAQIHHCGHVRGSEWNYQGTRQLANVTYAYFTSIRRIRGTDDLYRMAMASSGRIGLRLDTNSGDTPDLVLDVYRGSTTDRTAALHLWMPTEAISTPHIRMHLHRRVYYEIAHPWIQRVGLHPGRHLDFKGGSATPDPSALKRFDYSVLGDCSTLLGLRAPYDEEDTQQTFSVQPLVETNIFDFWEKNTNTLLHAPPGQVRTFRPAE